MLQRNTLVDKCNARFQQIFGDLNIHADGKIIVSHFGEFSQDLVNSLTTSIEEMMFDSGDKKGIVKRVFSILVEGLQNIRIHGERDEDRNQVSFLIVMQRDEKYIITFGNLVKTTEVGKITDKIEMLNELPTEKVKELLEVFDAMKKELGSHKKQSQQNPPKKGKKKKSKRKQ